LKCKNIVLAVDVKGLCGDCSTDELNGANIFQRALELKFEGIGLDLIVVVPISGCGFHEDDLASSVCGNTIGHKNMLTG
jgi:hypothetical protein